MRKVNIEKPREALNEDTIKTDQSTSRVEQIPTLNTDPRVESNSSTPPLHDFKCSTFCRYKKLVFYSIFRYRKKRAKAPPVLKLQSQSSELEYEQLVPKHSYRTSDKKKSNDRETLRRSVKRRDFKKFKSSFRLKNFEINKLRKEYRTILKPQSGFEFFSGAPVDVDISKLSIVSEYLDNTVSLGECLLIFCYQLSHSNSWVDMCVAILAAYKFLNRESILFKISDDFITKIRDIFGLPFLTEQDDQIEAQSSVREIVHQARLMFNDFSTVRESKTVKRFEKLWMYLLSSSLGEYLGYTYSSQGYSALLEEQMRRKYNTNSLDFHMLLIDSTIFMFEKGFQVYDTKNWRGFFHDEDSYAEFYESYMYIKEQSVFLANPESVGLILSDFLKKIDDTIFIGKQIVERLCIAEGKSQSLAVARVVNEIAAIKTKYLVMEAARAERDVPFSLLIFGTPGIGKSTITRRSFSILAKALGLVDSQDMIYTRSAGEKHWNNFNSSCWGLLFDDIASKKPKIAPTGDESVMDLLQVVNSVAFMPEQAAIENKGATPLLCKVVIATSNSKSLNAFHYFSEPSAAIRRFPFVVTVNVKSEWCLQGTQQLNGPKVAAFFRENQRDPEAWTFYVERVVVNVVGGVVSHSYVPILENVESIDFYSWLAQAAILHKEEAVQMKLSNAPQPICEHFKFYGCQFCHLQPQFGVGPFQIVNKHNFSLLFSFCIFQLRVLMMTFILWVSCTKRELCINNKRHTVPALVYDFCKGEAYERYGSIRTAVYNRLINLEQKYVPDKQFFIKMGKIANASFFSNSAKFAAFASFTISILLVYRSSRQVLAAQTSVGEPPEQLPVEKSNVYYNSGLKMSRLPQSSDVRLDHPYEQALKTIARSVFNLKIYTDSSRRQYQFVNVISIGGFLYVTVAHALKQIVKDEVLYCALTVSEKSGGVTQNVDRIIISKNDILFHDTKDLCVLCIRDVPPKFNLPELFSEVDPNILNHPGDLISRDDDGKIIVTTILRTVKGPKNSYEKDDHKYILENQPMYTTKEHTFNGLCGAPVCIRSQIKGVTCIGVHVAGAKTCGYAYRVSENFIEYAKEYFSKKGILQVQAGFLNLSVPSKEVILSPEIHFKSPVRYMEDGVVGVLGTIKGFRSKPKSLVRPTMICETVNKIMGLKTTCGPPDMRSPRPKIIALNDMIHPQPIPSDLVDLCADAYLQDIIRRLPKKAWQMLHPYDLVTTINGCAGVTYVDSMNMSTSMGFPYNCSKRNWIYPIPSTQEVPDGVMFEQEILDEMERLRDIYKTGTRCNIIFKAHLKDEAVSAKKMLSGKTRVFTGAPVAYSLLVRQYFLSFVRVIQNYKFIFECAVGTNAMSSEWSEIRNYLLYFGHDRIAAGDFASFDKSMLAKLVMKAFGIMISMAEHQIKNSVELEITLGFNLDDLVVMKGLAVDTSFPHLDFFGDLLNFVCGNPSGHPLTVIINCIVNSIYMRMAFALSAPNMNWVYKFQDYVHLITYGDDNVMNISNKISFFNHTVIQEKLASLGITYTMPDKTSESVDFVDLSDVDFLKRRFIYDSDLHYVRAPLDINSIAKMLNVHVVSKTVTAEEQITDIIRSANREFWFHGKEEFEKRHSQLLKVLHFHPNLEIFFDEMRPLENFETIKSSIDSFKLQAQSSPVIDAAMPLCNDYGYYTYLIMYIGIFYSHWKNGIDRFHLDKWRRVSLAWSISRWWLRFIIVMYYLIASIFILALCKSLRRGCSYEQLMAEENFKKCTESETYASVIFMFIGYSIGWKGTYNYFEQNILFICAEERAILAFIQEAMPQGSLSFHQKRALIKYWRIYIGIMIYIQMWFIFYKMIETYDSFVTCINFRDRFEEISTKILNNFNLH